MISARTQYNIYLAMPTTQKIAKPVPYKKFAQILWKIMLTSQK